MMHMIDTLLAKIMKLCKWCLILLGASMSILTFVNAIARRFGVSTFIWADEVNRLFFIYMTYLGLILSAYTGKQSVIDFLLERMKWSSRRVVTILGNLICIAFLAILTYGGIEMIPFAGMTKSSILQIPLGFIYACIPIGAGLTVLVYIIQTVKLCMGQTLDEIYPKVLKEDEG